VLFRSLREIADATVSPADLKEDLIHSLQKHVEVDEPEAEVVEAPALTADSVFGENFGSVNSTPTADQPDATFDQLSEEELLAGIEGLVPPEKSDDY